ncbi:MAG: NAD(+)/NADH kinase [Syntrophales bacterium LBB04]|nr:NAD(+)/NADH kinase [Syntrophales bacterium LBB04]
MMGIKAVGTIANVKKDKSRGCAVSLVDWLQERGIDVYLEKEIAEMVGSNKGMDKRSLAEAVDLLVVFGGDGTILHTARFILGLSTPIIGINLGAFGYLTEVNLNEIYGALEMILLGEYRTEKRMMLDAMINAKEEGQTHTVLNDIVVNRANLSRIVELETYVDGRYLITYKADGLIISTPTGSTAYSLSAGGPIVFPEQDAIIIIPICPHTLTNRPIILPADASISVVIRSKEKGAILTLDGQISFTLGRDDTLSVKKSHYVTTLISSPHRDYLEILRTKLGWSGLVSNRMENS